MMERKNRRFAVLNSPKPFSLDPKTSRVKSVHFMSHEEITETKAEDVSDSKNSYSLSAAVHYREESHFNRVHQTSAALVCQKGDPRPNVVHEPLIKPLTCASFNLKSHPAAAQCVSASDKEPDNQAYVKLAEFLSSINIGTEREDYRTRRCDERSYIDDDLDEILGENASQKSASMTGGNKEDGTAKQVNETTIQKVSVSSPANNSDRNLFNSITCLVEKPGEDDFVCPPLPPPPSEEDLAAYDSNLSPKMESSPPPPASVISPTYKAASTFNVWISSSKPSNGTHVAGVVEKSSSTTAPAGFRRVARPVSKAPEKGATTSTVTTNYSFPSECLPPPSESVRVTPNHELPDGAVYETQKIDGDMLHTDTYYPVPGESKVLERTKKTTTIKAEHHHGIGPTDERGVPIALRTTVDNPKAWYKNMFKQIHKLEQEDWKETGAHYDVQEEKPIVSQTPTYKPKKLGRITDYAPSEPYVVENKPQNNKIPPASTSYKPSQEQLKKPDMKTNDEPVHGTEYGVKDYSMADYVVTEPRHVVHLPKPKETKSQGKKQPARVKFDFVAQSGKQLGLKKNQIVIITREVNKDWYEGETTDGKRSGMFPVSYVEVLNQTEKKQLRRGTAKAKFNFNGTNPKQLSMKKGDTVELIEKVDQNWYTGSIGQRSGMVPANYIEVLQEPEQATKADGKKQPTAISKQPATTTTTKAPDFSHYFHNSSPSSSSSASEPDDKEKMSKASFLAHAVVNSGAHLSKPQTKRGEFDIPELDDVSMGIVQEVNGKPQHASQGSLDTTTSTTSSSLHSDAAQNLRQSKPSTNSVSSDLSQGDARAPFTPTADANGDDDFPVVKERHRALYQYVPQNEDELELMQGDTVQVVEKCDDGWYVGTCERTGGFGTFPGNYVILVD